MSFDLEDVPGLASPDYIALLKRLASFNTGPLALRIGGISADRLKTVWSDDILNALVKVNKATGARGPGTLDETSSSEGCGAWQRGQLWGT
jgi:hypothetical protein